MNTRERFLILGCSALVLTGCAAISPVEMPSQVPDNLPSDPNITYLTVGSAAEEYQKTIDAIPEPLPLGQEYPPGLPADFMPTDGYLESGAARNQAWFTWLCAWESEYLESFNEDQQRRALAEGMISRWPEMDFYTNVIVDPDRGWISNVIDPMLLGDPTGVKAEFVQSCGNFSTVATR